MRHKNGTDGGGLATRQIVNAEYQIPDTKSEAAATVADLLMIAVCFCLRCVNAEKPIDEMTDQTLFFRPLLGLIILVSNQLTTLR